MFNNKIKYSKIYYYDIDELYGREVSSPFPNNKLPDGEYIVRGNKKNHYKKYWVIKGIWYLLTETTYDNGQSWCFSAIYNLFPSLPKKEWDKLNSINIKYFNKIWQHYIRGYNFWCELRETSRYIHKNSIKISKNNDITFKV